jgi:mannose-6-phosphate isomerase-like protein (cupin superfamily)
MDKPLLRRARDCRTSRIKPADTNKFVVLVDPLADKSPFISVVEIFDVGGKTPLHHHGHAHEMFYVLSGPRERPIAMARAGTWRRATP